MTAAQRVIDVVNAVSGVPAPSPDASPPQEGHHSALLRRCHVSERWLGTQFKGILERAEAGSARLDTMRSSGALGGSEADNAASTVSVGTAATLIYQHAVKCGKEGAARQVLGQLDSAKVILCESRSD